MKNWLKRILSTLTTEARESTSESSPRSFVMPLTTEEVREQLLQILAEEFTKSTALRKPGLLRIQVSRDGTIELSIKLLATTSSPINSDTAGTSLTA
jgi:hypothetical protein